MQTTPSQQQYPQHPQNPRYQPYPQAPQYPQYAQDVPARHQPDSRQSPLTRLLTARSAIKVPAEITLMFWVVKLLTTAMGESTSDFLVFWNVINPYIAVVLGLVGLIVALAIQFSVRRYIPWVYWLAVVMVAIFGTMAADVAHVVVGIPYLVSTLSLAIILVAVFIAWYVSEGTLSIHSIYTVPREIFYWMTVMATFALGTAAGDLAAAPFQLGSFSYGGLGYLTAGILFAVAFALPALAYRFLRANEIATFWIAYVITRPLGASFADWFGKPFFGGLGLGDEKVAGVLTILIIIGVAYLTIKQKNRAVRGNQQQ